jgi:outer membrane protein TolC
MWYNFNFQPALSIFTKEIMNKRIWMEITYPRFYIIEKQLAMSRVIAFLFLFISSFCAFTQQKTLDYYINSGLRNSPFLKDYRSQLKMTQIDSMRIRAGLGPQVKALSANSYAPVINGWGYDEIITNGANIYAGVSVSKELTGNRNRQNQFDAVGLQYQSIENTGKITEQDLKKSITGQYIVAYGSLQQYLFNAELNGLLKNQEIILKTLAENGVYKQTEYLSFLVNIQQQELHMNTVRNQYRSDLSTLNYLCGIEDTSFTGLADPELAPDRLPEFSGTVFYKQFTIDSLKLQNASRQIDFLYKPKVSLFADGGYFSSLALDPYKNFGLNAGFTISFPIYDGGLKKIQHDKISIDEDIRRSYRDFYLSQSNQQINRFLQQLGENQRLSEDISRQVNYARTLIETYHKILEAGDIHMSDYIIAISNYLAARNMLVENKVEKYQIINELNYWNRTK